MTEILTESFCERCGTRYTFESVAPRQKRLGGFKTLGKGLKNFVLSDDSSLDEAMAAARSDVERETTTQQLDAFHRTFNFCMSCRQYTCANCWNGVEARCLSCAPMAGVAGFQETVAEPDLDRLLRLTAPPSETAHLDEHVHEHIHEPLVEAPAGAEDAQAAEPAWPGGPVEEAPLPTWAAGAGLQHETPDEVAEPADGSDAFEDVLTAEDLAARLGPPPVGAPPVEMDLAPEVADEEFEATGGVPGVAEIEAETEPVAAETEPVAAETEPVAAETEPVAAETEPVEAGLAGLEPGASLDDAIAAYEAALEEPPVATVADDPSVDEASLDEAAPLAATREAFAFDDAEPAPRALIDVVEQPTWPVAPTPAPPIEAEPVAAAEVAEAPEVAPPPEVTVAPEVAPPADVAAPAEVGPERQAAPARIAAPEPEPAPAPAAALEPEPAPAPAAALEPEPEAEPVAAAEATPDVAPSLPATPPVAPPAPAAPAEPTPAPQWPTGPRWPTSIPARPTTPQPAPPPSIDPLTAIMARQATEAMWALSSRDVVQPPIAAVAPTAGVQPCVSCGISLSANARFCRRCGTSQVG